MKRFLAIFLCMILMISMSACGRKNEIKTLRINALPNSLAGAGFEVMKSRKLLEKYLPEGTVVEWSALASGPDNRDAIVADKLDIAAIALTTFITSLDNDHQLRLVCYGGDIPLNIYSNREDVRSLADLSEHDRVAINNRATTSHAAFLAQVDKEGLPIEVYDKMLVPTPAAEAFAMLTSGSPDIAASIVLFPSTLKLTQYENVHMIADTTEAVRDTGDGVVVVTSVNLYDNHPEITDAFMKAYAEVQTIMEEEAEDVAAFLAELWGGVSAQDVLEVMKVTSVVKQEVKGYNKQAELLYKVGLLNNEPVKFEDLPNYNKIPK